MLKSLEVNELTLLKKISFMFKIRQGDFFMRANKVLYRDTKNGIIGGVAAGVAKYLNINRASTRLIFVILGLLVVGIPLYIILLIVLKDEPKIDREDVIDN